MVICERKTAQSIAKEMIDGSPRLASVAKYLSDLLGWADIFSPSSEAMSITHHLLHGNPPGGVVFSDDAIEVHFTQDRKAILAHEYLHCILALEGVKFPAGKKRWLSPLDTVNGMLLAGVSQHPIINYRLIEYGYGQELEDTSLPLAYLSAEPGPRLNLQQHREWFLHLMNQRFGVFSAEADGVLRPRLEEVGLAELYDKLHAPVPAGRGEQVGYINWLSGEIIREYDMQEQIELVGVWEFVQRRIKNDG